MRPRMELACAPIARPARAFVSMRIALGSREGAKWGRVMAVMLLARGIGPPSKGRFPPKVGPARSTVWDMKQSEYLLI